MDDKNKNNGFDDNYDLKDFQISILSNIKDTEMELSVVLAENQFAIEELYSLVPGSILQFDHLANDPVALAVNSKKFAEGTVVQSGDNYAFQILAFLT